MMTASEMGKKGGRAAAKSLGANGLSERGKAGAAARRPGWAKRAAAKRKRNKKNLLKIGLTTCR